MYKAGFEMGLTPDQFWNITMREYSYMREAYMSNLSARWDHTASIMSLIANVNSVKGKKFEPKDFHPFERMNSQGVSSTQEAMELLEKLKHF
jgi:hypothetical protein